MRFRRQYIIGSYIVDFYCHQAKLVVELDGSQHYAQEGQKEDCERTNYLESLGLHVLRFSNLDVLRNFSSVCDAIHLACANTLSRGEGASIGGGRGMAEEPTLEKV